MEIPAWYIAGAVAWGAGQFWVVYRSGALVDTTHAQLGPAPNPLQRMIYLANVCVGLCGHGAIWPASLALYAFVWVAQRIPK